MKNLILDPRREVNRIADIIAASLLRGPILFAAGTPTFDTVTGVAIAGGANTITLGKGATTITLKAGQ